MGNAMRQRNKVLAAALCGAAAVLWTGAKMADGQTKLHGLFGDNMVLQRGMPTAVYGYDRAGQRVTVEVAGQTRTATADAKGKWRVELKPVAATPAGESHMLTVRGSSAVTCKNVLFGDVWLCGGQSNMEVGPHKKDVHATRDYDRIRLFQVSKTTAREPLERLAKPGAWKPATVANANGFTIVGYRFGLNLHEAIDVPVGLIQSAAGSTAIAAWLRGEVWKATGSDKPAHSDGGPTTRYNAMVHPLTGHTIKGIVWWQGENDTWSKTGRYGEMFVAQIKDYRTQWGRPDLPFIYVQLQSSISRRSPDVRRGQNQAMSLPHTAMVVAVDVAFAIHPKGQKQDVAQRLALAARGVAYGEDIVHTGPIPTRCEREGDKLRLHFRHVGSGLELRTPEPPGAIADDGKPWQIAPARGEFVTATAETDGETVLLSAPGVSQPARVRYAQSWRPSLRLYNKEGLPMPPYEISVEHAAKAADESDGGR